MKYSLRFIFVLSILVGTGLGLYLLELEKRKPLSLKINYRVQVKNPVDRPAQLTEFRSRAKAREVDVASKRYEGRRIRELEADFLRFDYDAWYAGGFVERHPEAMRMAAQKSLVHNEFEAVVGAAWTLGRLGDKSGFDKLQNRILENREKDRNDYWRAFEMLGEEGAALSDEMIDQALEIANSDSSSADEAAFMLFRLNIDNEALLPHLKKGSLSDEDLNWALVNRPTAEVLSAIENQLQADPTITYRNKELYSSILKLAPSNPKLQSMVETVEVNLWKFLESDNIDQWDKDFCNSHLWEYATSLSIPFLQSQITGFDAYDSNAHWITKLYDLGETESAKKHFLRLVDELSVKIDRWNGDVVKNRLMGIGPQIIGPEETVELCIKYNSPIGLAEFIENSGESDACEQLGCDESTLASARKRAIDFLVEHEPKSDIVFSKFARHWHKAGLSRQKAVDWINDNLEPANPLTVKRVLDHERYPVGEGIWTTWSWFDHRVDDIHTFLLMALAHSGHGHLTHWEYTSPGNVSGTVEELATTESREFNVGACDQEGTYPTTVSLVVNDRVYQFNVHEGPNGSDERYDVGVIADLVNTIAVRQRLKRRLYIYESIKGYCLVMFIKPEIAREIYSVFSIFPDRGTDYYLDH